MRRIGSVIAALAGGLFWGCNGSEGGGRAGDLGAGAGGEGAMAGGHAEVTGIGGGSPGDGGSGADSDDDGIDLGEGGNPSCPSTCSELEANCGTVTDSRCGGVVECGDCAAGEVCGAVEPNQCTPVGVPCAPQTCEELAADCGAVSDGCGGLIQCGQCPTGQTCGANAPNRCGGGGGTCIPLTCADLQGVECGIQGDGCGDTVDCGGCPSGEECVARDGQSRCVEPAVLCEPVTCAEAGFECGVVGDGCGGTIFCGNTCALPKACGGDPDRPNQCGCTGLCGQIPDCDAGATTSISGTVFDPAGNNPLHNVLVYIPNDPSDPGLQPFTTRASTCDVCGATAAGDPLVLTHTGVDGSFTLSGVPVGQGIQLVVQLGRWRRIFEIEIPNACEVNQLPNGGKLTLPKNKSEGDIPLIAVVTGAQDGMECMLLKSGIDEAEFTNPDGTGRVHLYQGSGTVAPDNKGPGTRIDDSTPSELALYAEGSDGTIPLIDYDMLILACQGTDYDLREDLHPALGYWPDLVDYANSGGRVFATHWSYSYMYAGGDDNPLSHTAELSNILGGDPTGTGTIVSDPALNPQAAEFTAWLGLVGALDSPETTPATFQINEARFNVAAVTPPGQTWVTAQYSQDPEQTPMPVHFTFNTPVTDGTGGSCGRFVYSDFHVSNGQPEATFPANCTDRDTMTPQEKVLEFMLFDLSACVTPYEPLCTPSTCAEQGFECGAAGDGCGSGIDCGECPAGESCGLVSPGQCDSFNCTPTTCSALGYDCGAAGDGCGGALQCGSCPSGQTCGAAGPNRCGTTTATCTPRTCAEQAIECGMAGDGCGGALDCGSCLPPAVCGIGGPGQCGTPTCTPMTCAEQGIECGAAGDGCGAALNCGNCNAGMVCGLTQPGVCGQIL